MPAAQTFWTASSVDGRPLDWKVRSGEWSVVMMNADASPGVSVDASIGADAPFIRDLAWWLTIPGIGLGLIALVLVAFGVRGLSRSGAQPPSPRRPRPRRTGSEGPARAGPSGRRSGADAARAHRAGGVGAEAAGEQGEAGADARPPRATTGRRARTAGTAGAAVTSRLGSVP